MVTPPQPYLPNAPRPVRRIITEDVKTSDRYFEICQGVMDGDITVFSVICNVGGKLKKSETSIDGLYRMVYGIEKVGCGFDV